MSHKSRAEEIISPLTVDEIELLDADESSRHITALGYARANAHAILHLADQTAALAEQQRVATLRDALSDAGWTDLMKPLNDEWEPVRLEILNALGISREGRQS